MSRPGRTDAAVGAVLGLGVGAMLLAVPAFAWVYLTIVAPEAAPAAAVSEAISSARFDSPQELGGHAVMPEVLSRGATTYVRYCLRCHGANGDGRGPAARGYWPPPRDLRLATFKFAGASDNGLPNDAALAQIIVAGLHGTAMRSWDVPAGQLPALVEFIKTFSPPGKGFRSPRRKVQHASNTKDPYEVDSTPSVVLDRGAQLYHSIFQCAQCHPAYAGPEDYARWELRPPRVDAPQLSVPKWSETHRAVLLPPDFRRHRLKSVRRDRSGNRSDDLFRVVAGGLQGAMPGYGHLDTDDVWAVVHYVKTIADTAPTLRLTTR